jgi:hypothetical protein
MHSRLSATLEWIRADYRTHPLRFVVETWAWAFSILAAVLFAVTVPNLPYVPYLLITVTNCALYAWASWSRGSFGLLANYLLLTGIDTIALIRAVLA